MERIRGEGCKGYEEKVGMDTGKRLKRIRGEGWKGYGEKVGKDTVRRLERILGEGWKGYGEKVGKDMGRRVERIQGEGWSKDTARRSRSLERTAMHSLVCVSIKSFQTRLGQLHAEFLVRHCDFVTPSVSIFKQK